MHSRSCSVNFIAPPMKKPLLRMLWWVSVAPLGNPVVPLVNWMLIGSSNCSVVGECGEAAPLRVAAEPGDVVERQHARRALGADRDRRAAAPGAARRADCPARRCASSGASSRSIAEIVAGLEPRRGDQRDAADLVQRVFELGEAIGRVDVDQDQPGLGGRELGDDPFGVVRRPDADALAAASARARAARRRTHRPRSLQLAVGPADLLMPHDQRVAVAKAFDDRGRNARRSSRRSAACRWPRGHSWEAAWFTPAVSARRRS